MLFRFLAKEFGLVGFTAMDSARIDEIVDAFQDLFVSGTELEFRFWGIFPSGKVVDVGELSEKVLREHSL